MRGSEFAAHCSESYREKYIKSSHLPALLLQEYRIYTVFLSLEGKNHKTFTSFVFCPLFCFDFTGGSPHHASSSLLLHGEGSHHAFTGRRSPLYLFYYLLYWGEDLYHPDMGIYKGLTPFYVY